MLPEIIASFALLVAPPHPPSHLTLPPCEFPETYQFSAVDCVLELRNDGDAPIQILKASAAMDGDSMSPTSFEVKPRSVAYAHLHIAANNSVGRIRRIFRLETDEPGQKQRSAEAVGFVTTILDDAKPTIEFGVVDSSGGSAEKTLSLNTREVRDFRVLQVVSAPDYLDVSIDKDGHTLHAQIKDNAAWGLHEADQIKLRVNAPQQTEVWVAVKVDVHGDVVPDSNPYSLGLMRQGNRNEYLIRITSRSKQDFRVGPIELERIKGTAEAVPCEPAATGCELIRLRIADAQPTGEVSGIVSVDLPDYKRKLPIYVWGMLVGAKTEVKDFQKEMERVAAAKGSAESRVAAGSRIDLKQAIKQGVADAAPPAPPPGNGPLLKWSAAHEELVYGYLIYRADSEAGPYLRMNKDAIHTVSSEGSSAYQWRDTSAESGKTYWYYVGVLNKDGSKQQLSGPQRVVAK